MIFVFELTVPFEENFDWAHQRKSEKYEDLREQCVRNGRITNVFPIEVGCRVFIANSTTVFLTNLGLPPSDKRKYMEKILDKALTASALIWQSHRVIIIIWESLVVSGIAGPLWASGNDTSALKPCLNPESSSDEAFVRSNAVVQTSELEVKKKKKVFSFFFLFCFVFVCFCFCLF